MKPRLLIPIALMVCSMMVTAQNSPCTYSISGKVLDETTKGPVPYAVIRVVNSEKYTTASENGDFKIDGLCKANNTLVISSIGYSDLTI
ncbi:MAG: carboxypeptidase-like regulatory domain-containing protein, partial [Bacteroidota bacterium]